MCVCDELLVKLGLNDLVCVIVGDRVELIVMDTVPELLLELVALVVIDIEGVGDCDAVPFTDEVADALCVNDRV